MKKIILILVLFLTVNVYAQKLNLELIAMLQGNIGSYSQLTTVPAYLDLIGVMPVHNENLIFIGSARAFSGKTKLGSWGMYTPVNDVAFESIEENYFFYTNGLSSGSFPVDSSKNNAFILNNAYFVWSITGKFDIVFGRADITRYGSRGKGLAFSPAISDERYGFVSTHFLRPLALSSLEQKYYPSIPLLGIDIWLSQYFNIRNYVTFGMPTEHIFFRNSWGTEFNFNNGFGGNLQVHIGFADTEFSYTHHIAPCILLGFDQKIMKNFGIFGRYSQGEKHKVTYFFTDFQEHTLGGIFFCFGSDSVESYTHFIGIGASSAKLFRRVTPENVLEAFYRAALTDKIFLSPDIQLIDNPEFRTPTNNKKILYVWAVRFFCRI